MNEEYLAKTNATEWQCVAECASIGSNQHTLFLELMQFWLEKECHERKEEDNIPFGHGPFFLGG
jgi:hypothetical protein